MDQMTPHEGRVAEAILAVVDLASRVLTATPGSHYQWDKTHGLIEAANRLQQLGYGSKEKAVRGDLVTGWVVRDAYHHAIGRALFSKPPAPAKAAAAAYAIALEGETDPRLCEERGARLDSALDAMTAEELDEAYLAAHRLQEALAVAMMRRSFREARAR